MFASTLAYLLDILFPPNCITCGADGTWLCQRCLARVGPPVFFDHPCTSIDALHCLGSYDSLALQEAIKHLKYAGGKVLSTALGTALGVHGLSQNIHADAVIPVPLHPKRERARGFNQAHLIAAAAANILAIPLVQPVIRTRYTVPQVTLHEHERAANVADAFSRAPKLDFVPKHGIIVDDVFTTGATISEVARVLRSVGTKRITALTIAKG